ncbi:MAG: sortase [Anaerolineae bacterium]
MSKMSLFRKKKPKQRAPIKRTRPVQPPEFVPTAIYEDPPEGFVEALGDWGIRNRHYFLLGLLSIAILVVGFGMLITLSYTSVSLVSAFWEESAFEMRFGELAPVPTTALLAVVPEEQRVEERVETVILAPTATAALAEVIVAEEEIEAEPTKAPVVAKADPDAATPGRLIIPGIELEKDIGTISLVDNSWDIQSLGQEIGLLEATGRFPDDDFNMVFAGHVSTQWTFWGPFAGLAKLDRGSQVIYQWEGKDYVYEITGMRRIQSTDGSLLFQEEKGKILLLTCIGYDHTTGDYVERLLVEAQLVEEPAAAQ